MTAPVQKSSGAPVAHLLCATGEFAPRLKPAAQARATASLPVAQTQQAGFDQQGQIRASGASATMQHSNSNGEARMKIKAIPTTYAGTNFRSRLEARWAAYFDELNIPWEYEPFDLEGWAPDFVITVLGEQVLVEIKPAIVESIWQGGPRVLKREDNFEKAKRHWREHWVLMCGQGPNDDPDFFGIGGLCDAPEKAQALWFDMNKATGKNATEAAWRKAGNAVQWKAVPA